MKKALCVWGGWDGHEPSQSMEMVTAKMKEDGFDCEISDTLDSYLDEEKMKTYDVIVQCWTMGQISREQSEALRNTVKAGCGLAGWHGGLCDSFRQDTEYQFMTGGQWVAHPEGIIDYEVNILDTGDPITEGLGDFKMNSEQYYMHTDPGNEVLATTTFHQESTPWIIGTVMPQVWKRTWGEGRVFYSALGHVAKDFEVPEVLEIMRRGIQWAAR